nr:hypothetical protein [Tanacetum cinerariifolium]
ATRRCFSEKVDAFAELLRAPIIVSSIYSDWWS